MRRVEPLGQEPMIQRYWTGQASHRADPGSAWAALADANDPAVWFQQLPVAEMCAHIPGAGSVRSDYVGQIQGRFDRVRGRISLSSSMVAWVASTVWTALIGASSIGVRPGELLTSC